MKKINKKLAKIKNINYFCETKQQALSNEDN